MARNATGTVAPQSTNVDVASARQTFISTLESRRTAALSTAETAQATLTAATSELRLIEADLRKFGVASSAGATRGRGRPKGSKNAALPAGRTRHSNDVSLPDAVVMFMADQPEDTQFSINDVVEGVQAAGYRSTAENFSTIVNQQLSPKILLGSKLVRRVDRGTYALTARGRKHAAEVAAEIKAAAKEAAKEAAAA